MKVAALATIGVPWRFFFLNLELGAVAEGRTVSFGDIRIFFQRNVG